MGWSAVFFVVAVLIEARPCQCQSGEQMRSTEGDQSMNVSAAHLFCGQTHSFGWLNEFSPDALMKCWIAPWFSPQAHAVEMWVTRADDHEPVDFRRAVVSGDLAVIRQSLASRNIGNLRGVAGYLQSTGGASSTYKWLSFFRVRLDPAHMSEYYHCNANECEWRFACPHGPCCTTIPPKADRIGIRVGSIQVQRSACSTTEACIGDFCVERAMASKRLEQCAAGKGCFLSVPSDTRNVQVVNAKGPVVIEWEAAGSTTDSIEKYMKGLLDDISTRPHFLV